MAVIVIDLDIEPVLIWHSAQLQWWRGAAKIRTVTTRGTKDNLPMNTGTRHTLIACATAVLLAPSASLHAGGGFPDFSWERVPLYAHLGIGDGLEPEQYRFLADHFQLITFTGGITKYSVEPNIAAAARAIKQRNPEAKVLFYWASDMPKHQWKESNATFPDGGYLHVRKKGKSDSLQFDVRRRSRVGNNPIWLPWAASLVRDRAISASGSRVRDGRWFCRSSAIG